MRLDQTELFKGISEKSYKKIEKCLRLHIMSYKKGETVCHYGNGSDRIGIVLSGRAAIYRTDCNGYESLLENLPEGSVFSEAMSYSSTAGDSILVRSMARSDIAYLDYEKLLLCPTECKSPCAEYGTLRQNLLSLLINRSRLLGERVVVLGCHSIREKLLCFFRLHLKGKEFGKFELPFTWLELATYINTDRSAMMREINLMKRQGLIETNRYTVRVLR
ncbi:MAG: Crp/Fnr family transcriptional regulator [Clostridia bacterium]|nr:Crp/Fnr family transcriptional regulator [Clostridia bacterium]